MFSPPPSPLPPMRPASPRNRGADPQNVTLVQHNPSQNTRISHSKQRLHRSIRFIIVLVPLVLTLVAATSRFLAYPHFLELLATVRGREWTTRTKVADWSLHEPSNRLVKRSASNRLVARSTPTVPVNPVLPTPFPQPFDTTLSPNFSTNACYNFFLNMTQSDAFRSCRPFSLLITTSSAFEDAQNNIDLINTDVWGTCNTAIAQAQCDANMAWFASSLQVSCQIDLANQVATAVDTLTALQAFDLMRNAACQIDSATNSYCYVEAVADSDPSSYWFYLLPLGQPLVPNITTGACNECTSGLMTMYATALNSTNGTTLGGLSQTYNTAADTLNTICGSSYAQTAQVSSSSAVAYASMPSSLALLAVLLFAGVFSGI